MLQPLLALSTAAYIDKQKKKVQINDLIHWMTMFPTGPSLCVAAIMISTMMRMIVKTENPNWIPEAALHPCQHKCISDG